MPNHLQIKLSYKIFSFSRMDSGCRREDSIYAACRKCFLIYQTIIILLIFLFYLTYIHTHSNEKVLCFEVIFFYIFLSKLYISETIIHCSFFHLLKESIIIQTFQYKIWWKAKISKRLGDKKQNKNWYLNQLKNRKKKKKVRYNWTR